MIVEESHALQSWEYVNNSYKDWDKEKLPSNVFVKDWDKEKLPLNVFITEWY